ncbi:hypothetical protein Tco_0559710 [Tanacetum coccineum]
MNSPTNDQWELSLDIDDFDLQLTSGLHPCNNIRVKTSTTTQNPNVDNCDEKPVRIIPGPASIVQAVRLYKQADIQEGVEESAMSTQE